MERARPRDSDESGDSQSRIPDSGHALISYSLIFRYNVRSPRAVNDRSHSGESFNHQDTPLSYKRFGMSCNEGQTKCCALRAYPKTPAQRRVITAQTT